MLRRIFEVNPVVCPPCSALTRVVAVITEACSGLRSLTALIALGLLVAPA